MMSDDGEHRNGARETAGIGIPFIEKLIGKWTDANVLYLDLLGTTGRLDQARNVNRVRERQEVALTQTSFVSPSRGEHNGSRSCVWSNFQIRHLRSAMILRPFFCLR